MKFRHKIRSNHFPEVDKFFYWVDICLLSGFLSSFQKKTRKTVYLCVKQNNFYEKKQLTSILASCFLLMLPEWATLCGTKLFSFLVGFYYDKRWTAL